MNWITWKTEVLSVGIRVINFDLSRYIGNEKVTDNNNKQAGNRNDKPWSLSDNTAGTNPLKDMQIWQKTGTFVRHLSTGKDLFCSFKFCIPVL